MPRDDEKLLRQLSLVSFLRTERRPVTARHVQDRVEGYARMSQDTFTRRFHGDREDLKAVGITVETARADESEDVYYLPDENYRLPDLTFEPAELRALAIALTLLEGRFAYARPLRLALVALTHGHPDPSDEDLEQVAVSLAPDEDVQHSGQALSRFDDAIARGKSVRFAYRTSTSDETAERMLDPFGMFRTGGHWYVVGRDHDRDAQRTFRISRVAGPVRFLTKHVRDFVPPDDLDLTEFRARPPWQLGERVGEATVRVDDGLAWWVMRTYPDVEVVPAPAAASAEESPAGHESASTIFRTPYADEDALLTWVLSMGRRAVLLGPPELRRSLVERLERLEAVHA